MKVTRIACSRDLNAVKWAQLSEQAARLGRVRSLVWDRYGSISGVGVSDRRIRDQWMDDGTAAGFGVSANAWKETVRDAVGDITACRAAAKVPVRRAIAHHTSDVTERKRLYTALKADRWTGNPYLSRQMRQHCRRGHNHTDNQIIIRADKVRTFTLSEGGDVWLAVPGLVPHKSVPVPLSTTVAPSGTLRLILRDNRVEVHHQIDDLALASSHRPCGAGRVGVDKGYTEVLTDSDGVHHGLKLGELLQDRSDLVKARNARRAKLRSIANQAARCGDQARADRIRRSNLGTVKKHRQETRWRTQVRDITYQAVHAVADKATVIVAEDLTSPISGKRYGKSTNRRLAAWTKGVTAQALRDVSERRGSVLRLVNAAYTSQVIPGTSLLGRRAGDRLHCPHSGRVVWDADHAAAINVLDRDADPDIGLFTPHRRVGRIIRERADRHRSRLPDQDSNTEDECRCGERTIQSDG